MLSQELGQSSPWASASHWRNDFQARRRARIVDARLPAASSAKVARGSEERLASMALGAPIYSSSSTSSFTKRCRRVSSRSMRESSFPIVPARAQLVR